MKFQEYLVNEGVRQAQAARELKVTQPTVHNWI